MKKYMKFNNDVIIKKRIITHKVVEPSRALMKEIKKSQMEAIEDSVPLNFMKIDEKITTAIYKIPQKNPIKQKQNSNAKECQYYNSPQEKYIINTSNNDSIYRIKRRYNYQFEQFPTKDMGYRYYNQTQNNFHQNPTKSNSNNYDSFKKSKSPPPLKMSLISTNMNSITLFDSSRENQENILISNRSRSPANSFQSCNIFNSLRLRNQLNNSASSKNGNNLNLSKIKNKKIIINKAEGNANNVYDINCNKNMRNKSLNMNNNLYQNKIIYLDNNYNKPYYYSKNSYMIRSPIINTNKEMSFINNEDVGCRKILFSYDRMKEGKFLEKKISIDEKYINRAISSSSKKGYDKINQEIEIFENEENDEQNKLQFRVMRNFRDNYKYFERNEVRSPYKYEKTYHFRRSPIHGYRNQNYIIKDNKKIFISTLPKGKIIRLYRNNINNCNREFKTVKNRKFYPLANSQQFHMTNPSKLKKEKF